MTINQKTKEYSATALIQFPYFDAFLSDRWNSKVQTETNSNKDNNDEITTKMESKVSDDTSKKCDASTKAINIGNDMPFTLDNFDELINIPQKKYIDVRLKPNDLNLLLECESFFGLKMIDNNMIVQYLELSELPKTVHLLIQLKSL